MLRRKAMDKLIEWKNSPNKMTLIVRGARQVGKTYVIKEFAREYYDNYIYINFEENPQFKEIFEDNLSGEEIISQISLRFNNIIIEPKKTLIIFDEIQTCPKAITALKFLTIYNKYDVIASGSLLGVLHKDEPSSYPVGYVEYLDMYSLDFEEFCWANGINDTGIQFVKKYYDERRPVPSATHNQFIDLFKLYIIVGGMPKVVNEYITSKNFQNVFKLQNDIIEDYKADIIKYAAQGEKNKIRECFNSIPIQLAKENKKFQYKLANKNATTRNYGDALAWLVDARVVNRCYNLKSLEKPLIGYINLDCFKIYMADTGLFVSMLGNDAAIDIMNGNLGIYKGAIYENVIADLLNKKGMKLYYFNYRSSLELDFIVIYNHEITALEVKSADNTKSKSLKSAIENWNIPMGIKLSTKNISVNNNIINYPIYMVMFL